MTHQARARLARANRAATESGGSSVLNAAHQQRPSRCDCSGAGSMVAERLQPMITVPRARPRRASEARDAGRAAIWAHIVSRLTTIPIVDNRGRAGYVARD